MTRARDSDLDGSKPVGFESHAFSMLYVGLVLYALASNLGSSPYDDAYFFRRFATNFVQHRIFAWNVADGPVHGITSQLLLLLTVPLTVLVPGWVVMATKLLLTAFVAAAGTLLIRDSQRLTRRPAAGAVIALIAMSSPLVLTTLHTGMETAVALWLLALAIRPQRLFTGTQSQTVGAAIIGVCVYLVRPDAIVIAVLTFCVAGWRQPRGLVAYLAMLAFGIGACLILFKIYYGTALPLPFYAKSIGFTRHDPVFSQISRACKATHALTFLAFTGPLLAVAGAGRNRQSLAYVVAAVAFVAYHLVFTEDIMGYRARFLVPAVIPLALAAASSWDRFRERVSVRVRAIGLLTWGTLLLLGYLSGTIASGHDSPLERVRWPAYVVNILLWAHLAFSQVASIRAPRTRAMRLGMILIILAAGTAAALPPELTRWLRDAEYVERSSREVTTTRGLSDLRRCLPRIRQLYHSEIGIPGLVFADARVVDLAGLMSPEITLAHAPFDAYCLRDKPEALFLPHRNYALLNQEILGGHCIVDYTRVVARSSSPLYIRNDLVTRFRACARDLTQWQ